MVVGYECDGCELTLRDGLPVPTGTDGTPDSFTVLGREFLVADLPIEDFISEHSLTFKNPGRDR